MAITNWEKGQRYSIKMSLLRGITAEVYFPFSHILVSYGDTQFEMKGYGEFYKSSNNSVYKIFQNDTAEDEIINNFWVDKTPTKIEFVFDYNANNYGINQPSNNLKAICTKIDEKSLVSIYDSSRSLWVNLPTPSDYRGISATVVDSGRNSEGQVIAQVIKSDVAKIELKWNFLTVQQFADIAKLFEQNLGGAFIVPVSFFNITTGDFEGDISIAPNTTTNKVRLFYPNDRAVDFAHIKLDDYGKPIGYTNVSLNLIDTGLKYGDEL